MTLARCSILLIFLLVYALSRAEDSQTVTLTSGHFPPWISPELPEGGYLRHLITEAFEHSGYRVEWEFLPWRRALMKVREGLADGSAAWASHPGRDREFRTSIPVYTETNVLFRQRDTVPIVWDVLWMQPRRQSVCTPLGYTIPPLLQRLEEAGGIDLVNARTSSSCLKMVGKGHAQYAHDGLYSGLYAINRIWSVEAAPVVAGELALAPNKGHVLFNADNPESEQLVKVLNKGLSHLARTGRALALRERLLMPVVTGTGEPPYRPAPPSEPEGRNPPESEPAANRWVLRAPLRSPVSAFRHP